MSPLFRRSDEVAEQKPLESEIFRAISEWYHVAILELACLDKSVSNPRQVASALGISATEASLAVDRLVQLGLLRVAKNGRYVKTSAQLTSANKSVTESAFQKNQKQLLEKAIFSLENDPIQKRSHTSMTMAIDPEKLPRAKEMISEFNKVLCAFLESGDKKQIYNMSIALYPIQNLEIKGVTK